MGECNRERFLFFWKRTWDLEKRECIPELCYGCAQKLFSWTLVTDRGGGLTEMKGGLVGVSVGGSGSGSGSGSEGGSGSGGERLG